MTLDEIGLVKLNAGAQHRRTSWPEGIYAQVRSDRGYPIVIFKEGSDIDAPFGCTADDLVADDWEIIE